MTTLTHASRANGSARRPMRFVAMSLALAAAVVAALAMPAAADETIRVTADGQSGWLFNRDASTSTPYEFTTDEASIGSGSIYVPPIVNDGPDGLSNPTNAGADKFIAEQFIGIPAADLNAISYDFLIAGAGRTAADANEFYLNVYTVLPGNDPDTTYYDCRFDYVPTMGSTTVFTTASFAPTDIPSRSAGAGCELTLAEMPEGTILRAFAISVGDTSMNDTGLAGYYDNVVLDTVSGTTTWDFEAAPETKDDCRNGGFAEYGFKNQGQCIASIVSNGKK